MSYNIHGNWKAGWSLDLHTLKSIKVDESHFENTYSDIGKSLNLLKYHNDYNQIEYLANSVVDFLKTRMVTPYIDVIIPTPPSNIDREVQPVYAIANRVSELLNISVDFNYVKKIKSTSELKTVEDKIQRQEILDGSFKINNMKYQGKKVLLFDDLFRSGSTLNEITKELYRNGKVQNVYVVTLTKTRANGLANNY
jgi:predicted amidophosphoribosyltransferase